MTVRKVLRWVLPFLLVFTVAFGGSVLWHQMVLNRATIIQNHAAETASDAAQDREITDLTKSLSEANKRLGEAGLPQVPVVVQQTETGPKGDPGENATDAQVASAVADYCAVHGGCIGAAGQTGAAGNDGVAGKDGTNGVDGSPGIPGAVGPQGPAGVDGRGISSVSCQPDGSWLVTYSDGTTSTTDGPCRLLP